ncbi:Ltp family lipoprotein [Anaerocolumna xylanovorans]|uniref:Host cell surface-exposed lipoprotein n=1 Tax=Anaerocolumna xylanovorans DSM 12503 TaxID=1121345 RepID=A0A1M7Y3Q0_9FIRM|nr:Ltp family lipoprotein [Anaerocolumna xylanovorans]SHO46856.1 Host cell surface-exposed lipoprotein [Anaerocolumna xylanovorans DSM 12503]
MVERKRKKKIPSNTGQAKDIVEEPKEESKKEVTEEPKEVAPTTSAETSSLTMGQKNALSRSKEYLAYSSFSHNGLIKQLEFDGFSTEDATYAADNCGADWNEQAALKAQQYLNYSSFSRSGLIEQLEFDGFTRKQAEYGSNAVGY